VVVHDFADQWAELRNADVFVTHHGLGSTHEAVACAVPMLSLPFFWDQPALARRAQELGVALPLIEGDVRADGLAADAVAHGLDRVATGRMAMRGRLLAARQWEARTIASRPALAARILAVGR
jgi:UDP:flavonoid glycosyltransferase YjiC (YdhE family)